MRREEQVRDNSQPYGHTEERVLRVMGVMGA